MPYFMQKKAPFIVCPQFKKRKKMTFFCLKTAVSEVNSDKVMHRETKFLYEHLVLMAWLSFLMILHDFGTCPFSLLLVALFSVSKAERLGHLVWEAGCKSEDLKVDKMHNIFTTTWAHLKLERCN